MVGKNDSSGSYTYFRNGSVPGSGIISDSHATYTGVVSERRGGASKWMHQGVSGSNVLMTDASGNVTDTRTFDAFGKLLGSTGSNPDSFRAFAGFGLFWEAQYGGYSSGGAFFDPGLGMSQNDGGSVSGRPGPPSNRLRPMIAAVDGEGASFLPGGPVNRTPLSDFQCKANGFGEWVDDWMFGGSAKRLGDTVQRYQMGTASGWALALAITDFSVNMAVNSVGLGTGIVRAVGWRALDGRVAAKAAVTINREKGLATQLAEGATNTTRIDSYSGTAKYRVPDILDESAGVIGDVKDVNYLCTSPQLLDYIEYAKQRDFLLQIHLPMDATLSGPLIDLLIEVNHVIVWMP
ncbi:MAG: putative toxin [Fimbriimonadales bacterium]